MTEINIAIRDADTFESGGKTYRAVAFRIPIENENIVACTCVTSWDGGPTIQPRLIVEEVKPLHRTPTDEDALRRPACEYRNYECDEWLRIQDSVLVYVDSEGRFHVGYRNGGVVAWKYCRIPNET